MVSYAQNHEDVVLARAFGDQPVGTYVDVGAAHPSGHSVTRHFYEKGWSGVNLEPHPRFHALLEAERPRDVNLRLAAADSAGRATFYLGPDAHPGGSTTSVAVADELVASGLEVEPIEVELVTVAQVVADHLAGRPVDFLKVDVEGTEEAVLRGADLHRIRPRVVVVEATHPNSSTPSHEPWEHLVLDAGYRLCLFDGLNRFYARDDEPELARLAAAPANVFDAYVPVEQVEAEARAARAEGRILELEAALAAPADTAGPARQDPPAWHQRLRDRLRR